MWQKLKNVFWHLPTSLFWNIYYRFPSRRLKLIGVTGTDGKTTTCYLLYHTLKNAGVKVGLISTIGAKIADQDLSVGLHTTSPEPQLLQQIFSQMNFAGTEYAICEVSSHALDQYRFFGCRFLVSVITNTSHEHLDYHHTINEYVAAKRKLFQQSQTAILNRDDQSYQLINPALTIPTFSFGIKNKSDFQATKIKVNSQKLQFNVNQLKIITDSNYYYQVYNILAAIGVISQLHLDPQFLLNTIKNFPEVKGRRELVNNSLNLKCIIDFAHTPAGLKATLSSLRQTTSKGRLIVIFGATGGRDQSKRPIMGQVVSQIANIALITADDTRNENIKDINRQIISGIRPSKSFPISHNLSLNQITKSIKSHPKKFIYFDIPDRQSAFNLAIKIAQPNDIIVACGKGHEKTILHGQTEYPWSEAEAFRTAFKLRQT
jgi:UDP-N-acetylmuramoyl-L-alanyl-D-glutamate--2,6-diaminopimelate ligase